uniref:Uncharacterized protein n=1 Tax=Arundo donax TaxID=35708 RepID=A0A0A8Y5K3_ARUDO
MVLLRECCYIYSRCLLLIYQLIEWAVTWNCYFNSLYLFTYLQCDRNAFKLADF